MTDGDVDALTQDLGVRVSLRKVRSRFVNREVSQRSRKSRDSKFLLEYLVKYPGVPLLRRSDVMQLDPL